MLWYHENKWIQSCHPTKNQTAINAKVQSIVIAQEGFDANLLMNQKGTVFLLQKQHKNINTTISLTTVTPNFLLQFDKERNKKLQFPFKYYQIAPSHLRIGSTTLYFCPQKPCNHTTTRLFFTYIHKVTFLRQYIR